MLSFDINLPLQFVLTSLLVTNKHFTFVTLDCLTYLLTDCSLPSRRPSTMYRRRCLAQRMRRPRGRGTDRRRAIRRRRRTFRHGGGSRRPWWARWCRGLTTRRPRAWPACPRDVAFSATEICPTNSPSGEAPISTGLLPPDPREGCKVL